jgi:SAM-dependent methyltransferase
VIRSFLRACRGNRLLGTTYFIVLSNFLRTGIVDFLRERSDHTAALDEIVAFYLASATPPAREDIQLLMEYYRGAAQPTKAEFIQFLIQRAGWLEGRRAEVKFTPPGPEVSDWNPVVRALHAQCDPHYPGTDPAKRAAARAHWDNFLAMADAFGIVRYENGTAQLSERALRKLTKELEIFGDGYYGVDDLLGVLLKVEALRGDTSWIVRPPPFMLEACDAVARREGIAAYWRFSPRLLAGRCKVLDLGCGSGIYSNAFAEKNNECLALDHTDWVFYRAFLGARPGVRVECVDMNAMPHRITSRRYTHVISNLAAHHLRNRRELFARQRELLETGGEICVLNYDYSARSASKWNVIAELRRQFAAMVRYNWSVLEYDRGGVDLVSPQDVASEMEAAGFSASVHACGGLRELYFIRGLKTS